MTTELPRAVGAPLDAPVRPHRTPHATERETLLAIIRALAELHGVKPLKTRKSGDGWRKAAEALLQELAAHHPPITAPLKDPQRLAEKLREAFSLRE